jgi:DnaJ-domain-containing protein 1
VSIGKRLIDLARAELNSLLERAAREDDDDDDRRSSSSGGSSGSSWDGDPSKLSDTELAAEIERRRQARQEVEDAVHGRRSPPPPRSDARRSSAPPPRRTAATDEALRKAYAALEVPPGSDFEAVRKAYRRLMRKYHPDLHTGTPEKHRAATDLTQRLTEAYKTLDRHLRR